MCVQEGVNVSALCILAHVHVAVNEHAPCHGTVRVLFCVWWSFTAGLKERLKVEWWCLRRVFFASGSRGKARPGEGRKGDGRGGVVKGLKACFGRSGALQGWSKARRASRTLCTTRMAHGKEGPTSWEGKHESNGYPVRRPWTTLGTHACCVAQVRPRLLKRPQQKAPSSFPLFSNP